MTEGTAYRLSLLSGLIHSGKYIHYTCQPSVNTASADAGGPVTNEADLDPSCGLDLEDIINSVEDDGALLKFSPYLTIVTTSGEIKKVHKVQALKVLFEDIISEKGSLDL